MFKKWMCGLLAASMLLALSPAAFAAEFRDIEGTEYQGNIELLAVLGLLQGDGSGNYNPNAAITRAEFVTLLLRGAGVKDETTAFGETPFSDTRGHWSEAAVLHAYRMGIVDGKEADYFGADDPVTFYEALKVMVSYLGYRPVAEEKGGYPSGYLAEANRLNLLTGLDKAERGLTRGETARLYYNALTVSTAYSTGGYLNEGRDLLTSLGYTKMKGVVTSAFDTQAGTELNPNQIEISGQLYRVVMGYKKNLIGARVIYYLKDEMVYYMEEAAGARTIEVKGRDISESSNFNEFQYYVEDQLRRTTLAGEGLSVYYNGKLLPSGSLSTDLLKPASGNVILRDSDGDGAYELVIINAYETIVVRSAAGPVIYGRFGERIDTDIPEGQLELVAGGQAAEVSSLAAGMVLTVVKSLDNEKIGITVSERSLQGTVTSIKEDEYYIETETGGAYYTLTPEYTAALEAKRDEAETPALGKRGTFLLNTEGEIAAFNESGDSGTGLRYGYFMGAEQTGGLSPALSVRILTADNTFEEYEVPADKKIKFGAVRGGSYRQDMETASGAQGYLGGPCMVTYRLGAGNTLAELNCADTSPNTDYISIDFPNNACTYAQGLINQQYIADQNTAVFCIPNAGQYEDLFAAGRYTDFFVNASYNMELYDIQNKHIGAILYTPTKVRRYVTATDGFETILDKVNSPVLYISEIADVVVDGEPLKKVSGYEDGVEKFVYVGDMLNGRSDDLARLRPGCVIQYETNTLRTSRALTSDETPQMVIFQLIFDCNDASAPQKMTYEYEDAYLVRPAISTIHSIITNVGKSYVGTGIGKSSSISGGTAVMRWLPRQERFEIADAAELSAGQRIFIRQRYLAGREIVILED